MKADLVKLFTVCNYILLVLSNEDPCCTAKRLPNWNVRYKYYSKTTNYREDPALITGWYSAEDLMMLDEEPEDIYDCGTKFPVWLNGTHPDSLGTGNLCVVDAISYCSSRYSLSVTIRKCPDGNFVYYLGPTPSGSGYCFGKGVKGTAPTFKPQVIGVELDVETVPFGRTIATRTYAECKFEGSSTEELFYRVAWYQDGFQMTMSDFSNSNTDPSLRLTEQIFVDSGMQLGHMFSCAVEAYTVENGPPGPLSDRSSEEFGGILVLTPTLSFYSNEKDESKRTVRLQPTVPMGCVGGDSCKIELLATIPEESEIGKCNGISLDLARCGIEIEAKNAINNEVSLVLQTVETGQYKSDKHARLYLKVANTLENLIWPGYQLEPISIFIEAYSPNDQADLSEGKMCQANNDPHIYTFDRDLSFSYEIQREPHSYPEGVYVLFRNEAFNAEVQIQIVQCYLPWEAYCNCAVAVKSGQDIYQISTCNGTLTMEYKNCADGNLKVKSFGTRTYHIYMPYGTYVEVGLDDWSGVSFIGGLFLYIHVYPSTFDEGNTRGLCGTLDNDPDNDFHNSEGFVVTEKEFVETWHIKSNTNNMLHIDFDMGSLLPYNMSVCVCPQFSGTGPAPSLRPVSCDKNAVAYCSKGKTVSIHDCPDVIRTRRSVERRPKIPPVKIYGNLQHKLSRRATEIQNWTTEEAEDFCNNYMRANPVYELCEAIPSAKAEVAITDCVSDIMLTGVTDWAAVSKRTMQSACGTELSRNTTLRMSEYNKPSVADTIERLLCNNDCSGVGTCTDGECQCPNDFGGSDCSIDLTTAPKMYGLLDDGLCDEKEYTCEHAYSYLYPVSDTTELTCKLEEFYITWTNERIAGNTYTIGGEFSTLAEAICPLAGFRKKRSTVTSDDIYITGYKISLGNDGGILYSEGSDLYIYDSSCIQVEGTYGDVSFVLLEGFCWINGECVMESTVSTNDNCSVCNTSLSARSWSRNRAISECPDGVSVSATTREITSVPGVIDLTSVTKASSILTEDVDMGVMSTTKTFVTEKTSLSQPSTTNQATHTSMSSSKGPNRSNDAKRPLWLIGVIVPIVLIVIAAIIYIIKRKSKIRHRIPAASVPPLSRQSTGLSLTSANDIWIVTKTPLPDEAPPSYQDSCGTSNSAKFSLPPTETAWNRKMFLH